MWRPILVAGDDTQGQMRATTSVGLSFFIDDIGGRRYVGHTGTQNGFKTYLTVCPATHTASLLAFNTDTGSVNAEGRIAAKVIPLFEAGVVSERTTAAADSVIRLLPSSDDW